MVLRPRSRQEGLRVQFRCDWTSIESPIYDPIHVLDSSMVEPRLPGKGQGVFRIKRKALTRGNTSIVVQVGLYHHF